jgi:hypothetical protein
VAVPVIHQCKYSTAVVKQCAYSIAEINQCTDITAAINQYSGGGTDLCEVFLHAVPLT